MRLHGASWVALCCLVAAAYLFSGCSAAQFTARRALRTSSNENGQLMADFTAAAAAGDMELTLQLQNQLLKHSEEAYKSSNRRKLLQVCSSCCSWCQVIVQSHHPPNLSQPMFNPKKYEWTGPLVPTRNTLHAARP